MTVSNIQSHVAGLAGEDDAVISGVAIGNDDLTRGLEDKWKLWPADELRAAAASLEGTPVNPLHGTTEVGEVTKAGYDPERGIIYEAKLEDEGLAENIARGGYEVSIEARHADGGTVETDRGEAMLASDIRFTGMAIVQHGAAPSASAQPGEQAALSPADISAALEEHEDPASTEGDAEDIDISDSTETALENKVEEHNEEAAESKQVTLAMLKKVYRRGAGAWFSSNAGASQNQWAMARVNAFLEDLRNDRPLNDGNDNDLAPNGYSVAENAVAIDGVPIPETLVFDTHEEAVKKASSLGIEPDGSDSHAHSVEMGDETVFLPGESRDDLVQHLNEMAEEAANLVEVNGTEIDLTAPDRVKNAVEAGMAAKEEYDDLGDCGTGVGEAVGEAIVNDELTPAIILNGGDIADNGGPVTYLSSHAEDAPDSPPTEWDEETWTDGCGPVQYALWGHYLDWFEDKQAELQAAMEDAEEAHHMDQEADMGSVPEEYIFENPNQAVAKAEEMGVEDGDIHQHGEGEDAVFMPAASHDELMEMLRDMGEIDGEDAEMAEMKNIGPVDFTGTAEGELDESEIPNDDYQGHYLNAADTKSASSFPLVDADGDLRRGNLDAAWDLRGQGDLGMPREQAERVMLNLGLVFGPPDSEANPLPTDAYDGRDDVGTPYAAEEAAGTDDAVSPERGQAEVSAGGEPDGGTASQPAAFNSHMSDTEEELRARLSEKDDEIAELQHEVEQLEDEREDVARAYAEALAAGDTVFDADDLVEKFTVAELAERFDDTEAATLADVEPDVQSGGSENNEEAELSEAEQSEVAEHREVIADLAGKGGVAKHERERRAELVAEKTGEDPETILDEEA